MILASTLLACGGAEPSESSDGITTAGMPATATSETTTPSTTSSDSSSSTTDPATTSGPLIDVGSDDLDVPKYCGALDVVIVVERTTLSQIEMAHQVSPQLTAGIAERLPGWSVHYMHVLGADSALPIQCEQGCLADNTCDAFPELVCDPFDECDWIPGAGLRWRSSSEQCLTKPRRWVDATDDDAEELSFCIWETGAQHGPISALGPLLESVSPDLTKPRGCNDGFLREDAWLLPVIVSHGYPAIDGTPDEWAEELAGAKDGELDAIVPVALLDPQKNAANPPGCEEGPGDKTNGYHELVERFPAGRVGNLCEPYTPQILEAVDVIAEQCGAEIPN